MSFPFGPNDFVTAPVVKYDDYGGLLSCQIPRPSDFHNHFRLGALRQAITPEVSWPYKYVLAMPNTKPHIYTLGDAKRYQEEILSILTGAGIVKTQLVLTIYLAYSTTVEMIEELAKSGLPIAVKAYPPGGTTNSDEAAPLLEKLDVLKAMERLGVRLLIHGERVYEDDGKTEIPHANREDRFYRDIYPQLRAAVPNLKICLEHITTATAVEIVKADTSGNTVCTITPQHGMFTDAAFDEPWGGVHARCMPYLKGPRDLIAIRTFMTSGDRRAILGTDCAPHLSAAKNKPFEQAACGCYTPHAMAMYTKTFYECNALDERFVRFACTNGPDWWGLPRPNPTDTIRLVSTRGFGIPQPTPVPEENDVVVPLGWAEDFGDCLPLGIKLERLDN